MSDFELKKKHNALDYELKKTTGQFLNQNLFTFFKNNFQPSSTTCAFHIFSIHITIFIYGSQNLRQLDKSISQSSNKNSCTVFARTLTSDFATVPHFTLYWPDICKNLPPLVKLKILILKLVLSHTCLTSF